MRVSQQGAWNPDFLKFSSLFFPIMPYGQIFSNFKQWPKIEDFNACKPDHVCSFLSHNLQFVEQKGRLQKNSLLSLYEPRIFLLGEVSTRLQNWHDFFNTLIWYTFPKTKAILNMRQFIAYDENAHFPWQKPLPRRTREQDLLTMFDEGGCLFVKFINSKNKVCVPFLFGHGFYERLSYGDKDLSACTLELTLEYEIDGSKNVSLFSWPNIINKEILTILDEKAAKILADRNYYEKKNAFYSMSLPILAAGVKVSVARNNIDLK